ncbi:MAG: preprotein translocase subunit SecG [Acidobacteriia bacterium]|nr:preprotein translocase subunit SecG [Terriglobia bacterium]
MVILLTVIHVIVCLFLVVVVLLQSGKAADLAGAFGGMGSQTVFGPRGAATVLSRATTLAATLFMLTSLSLSILATRAGKGGSSTILDKAAKPVPAQKGAAPAAPVPGQQQVPVGGSVPIEVQPSVDGKQLPKQTVPAPVVPAPGQGKQ